MCKAFKISLLTWPLSLSSYDVSFDLCVTLESAIMKFSMEINGKEMGSVYANYD